MQRWQVVISTVFLSALTGCGAGSFGPLSSRDKPVLQSIIVTPASTTLSVGQTQQFTATGLYSDNSSRNLTNSVSWTSSNTSEVTISGSGLATSASVGSVTISALQANITGNATLTINSAGLISIEVTPSAVSVASGAMFQFTALGTFTDGSKKDITSAITWSSSNSAVASVDLNEVPGLAKGLTPGTSIISAYIGALSSRATLTVNDAALVSISLAPEDPTLPLGTEQQITAQGTYSDQSTHDITHTVTWSSSDSDVVSVSGSGLATARAFGSVTVTASSGPIVATTTISASAAGLKSMTIRPGNAKIAQNTSQQFWAEGIFSDGSTRNVTGQVSWTSSNSNVAKMIGKGLAKATSPGATTITATMGSNSVSITLGVTDATIVAITVTPADRTIAPMTKAAFAASGVFSDSTRQVITRDVVWTFSDTTVATVLGNVGTAVGTGTTNISAAFGGIAHSVALHVSSVSLVALSVSPATAVLAPGTYISCTAVAQFSDGTYQSVTDVVNWTSSASGVVSVNASGEATAESSGPAIITAQLGSVTATAALEVDSTPLASVQITPQVVTIPSKTVVDFVATGIFADGNTQDLTSLVSWTSSQLTVATISDGISTPGEATGIAPGTAVITALFKGLVGTASLTVR